ncbi:MAG: hypothetical protein HYW85_07070 [Deltaproteobacteria bacterium]|nr:hypothetical protein [Deltaproteobacteria bacterium]MBI3016631.1 hypothetical protein [Deltaproteobacteria bacterium]
MNKVIEMLFVILLLPQILFAQSFLKTPNDQIFKTGNIAATAKGTYLKEPIAFDNQSDSKTLVNGPSLNLLAGIGERIDFELNWDIRRYIKTTSEEYQDWGDVSFFTKIKFLSESSWPSFNVRVGAKLPNAPIQNHAGTDLADAFIWAASGKQLGPLHCFTQLGLEIIGDRTGGQNDALSYGIAFTSSFFKQHFILSSEIAGRYEKPSGRVNQAAFKTGLSYIRQSWQFDLGLSRGLIAQSESFGVMAGLTRTFHAF